jgi:Flp pilus assembly protein CpaB
MPAIGGITGLTGGLIRGRHRHWTAAACAALAVLLGLSALAPRGEEQVAVLVASRDLALGAQLRDEDVREVAFPTRLVPLGVLRTGDPLPSLPLASPVREGEPLTDVRFDAGAPFPEPGAEAVAPHR